MADLGKIIYKRYKDGIPMDEEEKALCEQIDQRMEQIEKYKSEMDNVKGNRFCPSCGNPLGRNDAYCSMCGAACPVPEPEEEAGDTVDGTAEEVYEAEESETVETSETKTQRTGVKSASPKARRRKKPRKQKTVYRKKKKLNNE